MKSEKEKLEERCEKYFNAYAKLDKENERLKRKVKRAYNELLRYLYMKDKREEGYIVPLVKCLDTLEEVFES
jgi:hypothetical protein